jgi:CHAD domain-containing protein
MLYTVASPEFCRSGLRRLNDAAEVAEAVISDVQTQFEPDEFRQLVRLLGTLGDMSPTAGAE